MAQEYNIKMVIEAQNKASAELTRIWKDVKWLQSTTSSSFWWMSTAVKAFVWAWGLVMLKNWFTSIVEWAREDAVALSQLENTLKATWWTLWLTSTQIASYWTELSELTGIQDDAIMSWQNVLVRYEAIGKDIFPRVTKATADLAAWLNNWLVPTAESMASTAKILWLAMEDPIAWLWKLRKAGIVFSESQEAVIKSLVEAWRSADAQKLILTELESKYKWAAEASTTAWDKMKNSWSNLSDTLWATLLPVLDKLLTAMIPIIKQVTEWIWKNPELSKWLLLIAWAVGTLWWALLTLSPILWALTWVLAWPAWFVVALGLAYVWLTKLIAIVPNYDTEMNKIKASMAALTLAYQQGKIPLAQYQAEMAKLQAQFVATQAKAKTFLWTMSTDFSNTFWNLLTKPIQYSITVLTNLWTAMQRAMDSMLNSIWKFVVWAANQFATFVSWPINKVIAWVENMRVKIVAAIGWINSILAKIWKLASSVTGWVTSAIAKVIWWKAMWWPVMWNQAYIVWEQWPELFVPSSNWKIIPNDKLGSNWWWWIVVNIANAVVRETADIKRIASELARQIELKRNFSIS